MEVSWHGKLIPFQTPPPLISSQLAATASSNLSESQLRAFWDSLFLSFHFGTIFWLPFWELCIGWTSIKFAVFYGVFPSYRGLIWCSSGMAGGRFMTWKGNTISDPSPLISSQLAATASSNLWEKSVEALWDSLFLSFHFGTIFWLPFWELCTGWTSIKFAVFYVGCSQATGSYRGLIWCSSGMAGGIFMTWKGNTISDPSPLISSQLAATASSSLWESQLGPYGVIFFLNFHFGTIFWLPFWEHYALAEQASNLKCSMGCSQATGV